MSAPASLQALIFIAAILPISRWSKRRGPDDRGPGVARLTTAAGTAESAGPEVPGGLADLPTDLPGQGPAAGNHPVPAAEPTAVAAAESEPTEAAVPRPAGNPEAGLGTGAVDRWLPAGLDTVAAAAAAAADPGTEAVGSPAGH